MVDSGGGLMVDDWGFMVDDQGLWCTVKGFTVGSYGGLKAHPGPRHLNYPLGWG